VVGQGISTRSRALHAAREYDRRFTHHTDAVERIALDTKSTSV
jgi:hypothetical protein